MEVQLKRQEGNKMWVQDDLMSTSLHFQDGSIFKNIKHFLSVKYFFLPGLYPLFLGFITQEDTYQMIFHGIIIPTNDASLPVIL